VGGGGDGGVRGWGGGGRGGGEVKGGEKEAEERLVGRGRRRREGLKKRDKVENEGSNGKGEEM